MHAALGWNREAGKRNWLVLQPTVITVICCCGGSQLCQLKGGAKMRSCTTGERTTPLLPPKKITSTPTPSPPHRHTRRFPTAFACQLKTHILTKDPRDAADRRLLSARKCSLTVKSAPVHVCVRVNAHVCMSRRGI